MCSYLSTDLPRLERANPNLKDDRDAISSIFLEATPREVNYINASQSLLPVNNCSHAHNYRYKRLR